MSTKWLDLTGLSYFWSKIKAYTGNFACNAASATKLKGPKHSYTTAASQAKDWLRIANATRSQIADKPLHLQFMLKASSSAAGVGYYQSWYVDLEVYGQNAGCRAFGNTTAPFSQCRVLYENTASSIDSSTRPCVDLYLNYVLTAGTVLEIEEIYNEGFEFVADGQLAASSVPSGYENRATSILSTGVVYSSYATYTNLYCTNLSADTILSDSNNNHCYRILNCTGTITLTLPSWNSSSGWFYIKNNGTGVVTLHPATTSVMFDNVSEDITLQPKEFVRLACQSNNHYSIVDDGRWMSKKANDSSVVHKTGDETVAGTKTFSNTVVAPRFNGAVSMYKLDAPTNENSSGTVSTGLRSLIDTGRSCKTAFIPATNITIEYSIDGSTWLDYGASDEDKQKLFAMYGGYSGFSVLLGKGLANAMSTNCKLRVTIVPVDRYAQVDMLYLFVCAYNHTMKVDIERSTIGAKTTFASVRAGTQISGWSGPNVVSFPVGTFGGDSNQTSNSYAYRFIFYCTAIGSNTNYPNVQDIRMYGSTAWTSANSMMKTDHLYSWDYAQNASFPAQVTATKFIGALQGNAATATKLATPATINGVSFDGSNNITIADSTKLPLTGGTLTGNVKISKNNPTFSLVSTSESWSDLYFQIPDATTQSGFKTLTAFRSDTSETGTFQISRRLNGGANAWSGPSIQLRGSDGNFLLEAQNSTQTVFFRGQPNGTLTWDGQPIQITSDERLKTTPSEVPGAVLDAWEDVNWGQFQYLDAVGAKGEAARLHLGLIAQHVVSVFERHGLDACDYGILCYEPAANLWMVRYTEALCMEAMCQRRRADRLEARIAAIEEAMNA